MISVIICTIRRWEVFSRVLDTLEAQTHRDFEVLIVGAEGGSTCPEHCYSYPLRFLSSERGLAQARNQGLRHARGSVYCFLDDDVELPSDFVGKVAAFFANPAMSDVGGLTGYDTENYPHPVSLRWKLRSWLGITPSLEPGDASALGRSVPFTFLKPFSGYRDCKWLPGFCQIFRRSMVDGVRYNTQVVVEDREFSMRVGDKHRLVVWGDLRLAHKQDTEARHSPWRQTWRAAFGLGHSFASRSRSWRDWITVVHVLLGELLIDALVVLYQPRVENVKVGYYRLNGYLSGLAAARAALNATPESAPSTPLI